MDAEQSGWALTEADDFEVCEMEEILAGFSRIYSCMGDICLKKGLEDDAEVFYRKFRVLNPEVSPARDILQRLEEDAIAVQSQGLNICRRAVSRWPGVDEELQARRHRMDGTDTVVAVHASQAHVHNANIEARSRTEQGDRLLPGGHIAHLHALVL